MPQWIPDRDRWNREPYTHTISVVDLRHWLPHLNMGEYALVADGVRSGDLYVWCERGRDDGPIRAEFGRALSIGSNSCLMLTTSGLRRIITPARHPFRFRVVGHASAQKGYAPPPRSETPVAVMPRLHGETATAYMAAVLNHVEDLRRGVDAIRAAQGFVRFEIEKTPEESEYVYTYAGGFRAHGDCRHSGARSARCGCDGRGISQGIARSRGLDEGRRGCPGAGQLLADGGLAMARKTNRKPRATATGAAKSQPLSALHTTLQASLALLDNTKVTTHQRFCVRWGFEDGRTIVAKKRRAASRCKLVNGEAVSLSSQQRVRLELAGMIREGPKGIDVTLTGRNLAREKLAHASASDAGPNVNVSRDRRGRRMPFQRKSIF